MYTKCSNDLEMPDAVPADIRNINFSRVAQTFRPVSYTLEDLPDQLPVISKRTGRFKVFSKSAQKSKRVVSMPMLSSDDTDTSTSSWPHSMPERRKPHKVMPMFQKNSNKVNNRNFSTPTLKNYREKELPPPPPIEKEDKIVNQNPSTFYSDLGSLKSVDSDIFRSIESIKLNIFEEYFYESPSSLPSSIYFTDSHSEKSYESIESSVEDFDSTIEYLRKAKIGDNNNEKPLTSADLCIQAQIKPPSSFMPIKNNVESYTESINTDITRRHSLKPFGKLPPKRGKKPYIQPQLQKDFYLDSSKNYNYTRYISPLKSNKNRVSSAFY